MLPRFASSCPICLRWDRAGLCDDCVNCFAPEQPRCVTCGLLLPPHGGASCGACLLHPPPLIACAVAAPYAYPWIALIGQLKFHQAPALARHLAAVLSARPEVAEQILRADWIVPIPLAPHRLHQRGYNQAWELARHLIPRPHRGKLQADLLLRLPDADQRPQSALDRTERLRHMAHAFAPHPLHAARLQDRRVLLVDDVMTTGATLHSAAAALLGAGASAVAAVVFARTDAPQAM